MTTRGILARGQARALREAAETWKIDHQAAMAVRDLEDLVAEGISMAESYSVWRERCLVDLYSRRLPDVIPTGEALHDAGTDLSTGMATVEDCIQLAESIGYQIDQAEAFRKARKRLDSLLVDLADAWPQFDLAEIQRNEAQIEAGHSVALEDLLS